MKFSNKHEFNIKYNSWLELINDALRRVIVEKESPEKSIYQAMNYSLMAGGKRIRPVLSLAVCEMLGGDITKIIPYACSIELIHTYSLIHDDLPAMDNDDYRRGKLTNHKVYGEAIAVLAGDALLTYAFEMMTDSVLKNADYNYNDGVYNRVYDRKNNRTDNRIDIRLNNLESGIKAINYIAKASGVTGMIGGQVVDLESESVLITGDLLEYMHKCKTGAIIKASVMISAIIMELDKKKIDSLERYSEKIGLAFQIKDDILDVEGNPESLGKKTGKDAFSRKSTFVTLYGLKEAELMLKNLIDEAVEALDIFGDKADFLKSLAYYIGEREC
mgnify:CR=1 FL=1